MAGIWTNRLRKWLWRAVVVAVSVVALTAAAATLVGTRAARDYARKEAEAAIRRELGLRVQIDDVYVDPYLLYIVARGITLDHPEHGRLAKAKSLRIRPSLLALLRGRVDLQTVVIEQAELRLLERDGRVLNFPKLPETPPESAQLKLPFRRLEVKESRLLVDAWPLAKADISRIDVEINGARRGGTQISLSTFKGFIDHAAGRESLERMELVGRVDPKRVRLDLLRIDTPDLHLSVRRAQVSLPLGGSYSGQVALGLNLARVQKWPHGFSIPPLQGILRIKADVSDEGKGPVAQGKLIAFDVKIMRYGLGERTEFSFQANRERVSWNGYTRLIREGGTLHLDGGLEFGKELPIQVRAKVETISFAKLMEQLGITPNARVDWTLEGGFELNGTLNPFHISGPLHVPTRDFRITLDAWHQAPARHILTVDNARVDGTVTVRSDGIHLEQMRVGMPRSRLRADVLLGFDDALMVRGAAEYLDLADCTPLLDFALAGRGKFAVQAGGTMSDPVVGGQIEMNDFAFDTFPLGDIKSDFKLEKDNQVVRFGSLKAKKRESRYRVENLLLDFTERRFSASGNLFLDRMKLADLYHVFHYEDDEHYKPYQGVVSGQSRLRYTLGYPGDSEAGTLLVDLDADLPECSIEGVGFNSGRLKAHWKWLDHRQGYRGGELALDGFSVRKGDGTVSLSGKMGLGGALDMIAVADRIAMRDTEGLAELAPELSGNYGVTGTVKGTLEAPRVDLDLAMSGLGWRGKPLSDGRLFVRLTDQRDPWVRAALGWNRNNPPSKEACPRARLGLANANWPPDPPMRVKDGFRPRLDQPMAYLVCGQALGGQLQIDLAIGRTQAYPVRGIIDFKGLRLGPFIPQQSREEPLNGTLSGRVELRDGALSRLDTLVGRSTVASLEFGRRGLMLRNNGPIEVYVDRGSFQVVNAYLNAPSSHIRIWGYGSFQQGMALSVEGDIDLGLLFSLSKTVSQTSGRIGLQFSVTGPMDKPAVYGHASISDGALLFANFPEPIQALNGRVTFSAQQVLLENFSARVAGGRLALSGSAELQKRSLGKYDIQIEAKDVTFAPSGQIDMKFGGQADLRWSQGQRLPLLTGTINLDRLRYGKPIKMGPALSDMYRGKRAETEPYDPEQDRVQIDLRVVHGKPLRIANNLLDAELAIRDSGQPFRLVGTDQRFGLLGNMAFKRGVLHFRQTDFEIRQGEISFADPNRVDPQFDVTAVTEVRRTGELSTTSWRITLHAKGSGDSFKLSTSAEPYLSEEDIALLLTIGMTRAEVEQSQTGNLTETAALEALASVTGVDQEVKRAVPAVDDFRITSAYSNTSGRTEPQVSVGKRIADRVRLNASTGLAASRDFSTGVEWQLSDQTSVKAMYDNQKTTAPSQLGNLGLDLTWRLEFK